MIHTFIMLIVTNGKLKIYTVHTMVHSIRIENNSSVQNNLNIYYTKIEYSILI